MARLLSLRWPRPHPLDGTIRAGDAVASPSKFFEEKLIRFGSNMSKIWVKFGQEWLRFGQIWLDLGKFKILHPQKHSISYGYECDWDMKAWVERWFNDAKLNWRIRLLEWRFWKRSKTPKIIAMHNGRLNSKHYSVTSLLNITLMTCVFNAINCLVWVSLEFKSQAGQTWYKLQTVCNRFRPCSHPGFKILDPIRLATQPATGVGRFEWLPSLVWEISLRPLYYVVYKFLLIVCSSCKTGTLFRRDWQQFVTHGGYLLS